jgi:2-iminobutanoate/2-iminopropanoate deaminase
VSRTAITEAETSPAIAPFSTAVSGAPTLFISGQVGLHPDTGQLSGDDAAGQLRQALSNLGHVLHVAGKTEADVLRVGLYLTDMADFAAVNEVYEDFFSAPYPARTAIAVAGLPLGALVEIDAFVG